VRFAAALVTVATISGWQVISDQNDRETKADVTMNRGKKETKKRKRNKLSNELTY